MIGIFTNWTIQEKKVCESFGLDKINQTIVLQQECSFGEDITSPYEYYVQKYSNQLVGGSPLFANLLEVPDLWEIRMLYERAEIWDEGVKKAEIEYADPIEYRNIKSISWLLPGGILYKKDYYNRYGKLYCAELYGDDGVIDTKIYLADEKTPVIICQPKFEVYTLIDDGREMIRCDSEQEFLINFLNTEFPDEDVIFTNDLNLLSLITNTNISQKRFIVQKKVNDIENISKVAGRDDVVFLHEKKNEMERWKKDLKIPCQRFYRTVSSFPQSNFGDEVFILTNSDQIEQLEKIVTELPELHFHIGAITLMSEKLMDMQKYENVSLYPGISQQKREELFKKCTYYLDINHYSEICDALFEAFRHGLLILGFDITIHEDAYVLLECIFSISKAEEMISLLKQTYRDKKLLEVLITKQNEKQSEWKLA